MKRKAVFLDRDGTVIEDKGYICCYKEVEIYPFTVEAIRMMNQKNYEVIFITNQSSIARGICTPEQVEILHQRLIEELRRQNAVVAGVYYCPYHKDGVVEEYSKESEFRKPGTGMILQASQEHHIQIQGSYFAGDNITDVMAGFQSGCKTVLLRTGQGMKWISQLREQSVKPDFIMDNILELAEFLPFV